ncbi:unnamed protein product [Mesocestoides corti]|uniref:Uncharacterized protein n=1 Tax=Mesocestoides corti TaxID=53468 RepID=A0A0R3UM65_MESCO|nr:unnamed protein product [Mesocestoides corti]
MEASNGPLSGPNKGFNGLLRTSNCNSKRVAGQSEIKPKPVQQCDSQIQCNLSNNRVLPKGTPNRNNSQNIPGTEKKADKGRNKVPRPQDKYMQYIKPTYASLTIRTKTRFLCDYHHEIAKDNYANDENEDMDDLTSHIYVTYRAGSSYRLSFLAENITMEPLFIFPRSTPPSKNEKISQIKSRMRVADDPVMVDCVALKRPKYSLDESTEADKVPLPQVQVYTTTHLNPNKGKNSISRPTRSSTTGFICLKLDDLFMKVRVEPLPITKIRPPITKEVKSTMERLRMPCSEEFKNKAQLLVRFRNDILRIKFDLSDCNVSKLPECKSLAVQTDTRMIIRQRWSPFTNQLVNLQIPETTYIYNDPMIDIRRLNRYFAKLQIFPLWKYEMFQKRVSQMRVNNTMEGEIRKVIGRNRGSFIVFDGFDAIATASGGLLCARVVKGREYYEEKIRHFLGIQEEVEADEDGALEEKEAQNEEGFWEGEEAEETLQNINMPSSFAA